MDKLNNEDIKRLLESTTVDIDVEAGWDAIESTMDKKTKKRRSIFWWFGGSLLLIIGLLSWNSELVFQTKENKYLSQNKIGIENIRTGIESENKLKSENRDIDNSKLEDQKLSQNNILKNEVRLQQTNTKLDLRKSKNSTYDIKKVSTENVTTEINPNKISKSNRHTTNISNQLIGTSIVTKPSIKNGNQSTQNITNESTWKSNEPSGFDLSKSKDRLIMIDRLSQIASVYLSTDNILISDKGIIIVSPERQKSLVYLEGMMSYMPKVSTKGSSDPTYSNTLIQNYKALSRAKLGFGYGRIFNSDLRITSGISYTRDRFVYRGQTVDSQLETFISDAATIWTNSLGGNFATSGERTRTTTTTSTIQQYSYQNQIGLDLGLRYSFLRNLYVGTTISWSPIQWQSGNIVSYNEEVVSLNSLHKTRNSIRYSLELGFLTNITSNLGLETTVIYHPNQTLINIHDSEISSELLGGQLRLTYKW